MMNGKVTVKTPFSWTFFDPIQSKQNVEKRGRGIRWVHEKRLCAEVGEDFGCVP